LPDHPPLIQLNSVSVKYNNFLAVNNVSLTIQQGETLGLVGESGSGKSSLGKAILGLTPGISGEIIYGGSDILQFSNHQMKNYRRNAQMIFQDPYASLNPRLRVGDLIGEPFDIHKLEKGNARRLKVLGLLKLVDLPHPYYDRYPSELSGGERQRVGIARALALSPDFLFCDEPVSALDVIHQMEIIHLLKSLQEELGLTILFVTHDIGLVNRLAHRIAVMHSGEIVEMEITKKLMETPRHPYTQALLSAVPIPDPRLERERNNG